MDDEDTAEGPRARTSALIMGAIGVVFGDIGTSPIYTMREFFGLTSGLAPTKGAVLGAVSMVFWSLIIIVTLKYVILIMRADNRGEGGVLALSSLALQSSKKSKWVGQGIMFLSIIGLGLFFGDSLITPAISVLSAVEGLNAVTHGVRHLVVPIAIVVLVLLFLVQSHGTERVAKLFAPIMLVWFLVLAALGLWSIIQEPRVLDAISPYYAVALFIDHGWLAFASLGAVILAVTGAEALYADMGHFGRGPIRIGWSSIVLPALLLNYFGQGALTLRDPNALEHLFFLMAPDWALLPLVLLATAATIIASQAVISGAFSLTHQAIQLGYLPRMEVLHTSPETIGQIYIPRLNWLLAFGVLILVVSFGSSANLAAAYGIAVIGVMTISTILAAIVARWSWGWRRITVAVVFLPLLVIDLGFLAANSLKIFSGGWFPLLVGLCCWMIVVSWLRGRDLLFRKLYGDALPVSVFLENYKETMTRVPGTAVFMTRDLVTIPHALLHNLKHNYVMHARVLLMQVDTEPSPYVPDAERVEVERLGKGFYSVRARYGFMQDPDVPRALALCHRHGVAIDMMQTSFFVGHETMVVRRGQRLWRPRAAVAQVEKRLFRMLSASAESPTAFFHIPPNRVVELGAQIEL